MAFGTPAGASYGFSGAAFQSLFFWNGLWDHECPHILGELHEFQSLFFWNGLWDRAGPGGRKPLAIEFQSLFFWNGLWD